MAIIIGLYLLADVLQHKGQARVLLPENFPELPVESLMPQSKSHLIFDNKIWFKGINTIAHLNEVPAAASGIECDVYFDTAKNNFAVQHDADKSTGLSLEDLLQRYRQRNLRAAIWLDIKNLDDANVQPVLRSLIKLRNTYNLQNKLLVESGRASLLTVFSDSGFYTSYYTPMFNPYRLNHAGIESWVDSITTIIKSERINALSGYYFQYPFLEKYFPDYPLLVWAARDRFSLVNRLFNRKIARNNSIAIALYP